MALTNAYSLEPAMNATILRDQLEQAASHLLECAHVIGQEQPDPMRASRAYADAIAFLVEIGKLPESHSMAHKYVTATIRESLIEQNKEYRK